MYGLWSRVTKCWLEYLSYRENFPQMKGTPLTFEEYCKYHKLDGDRANEYLLTYQTEINNFQPWQKAIPEIPLTFDKYCESTDFFTVFANEYQDYLHEFQKWVEEENPNQTIPLSYEEFRKLDSILPNVYLQEYVDYLEAFFKLKEAGVSLGTPLTYEEYRECMYVLWSRVTESWLEYLGYRENFLQLKDTPLTFEEYCKLHKLDGGRANEYLLNYQTQINTLQPWQKAIPDIPLTFEEYCGSTNFFSDIANQEIISINENLEFFINSGSLLITEYLSVLVYFLIATLLSCVILGVSYVLVVQKPETEKTSRYECGFESYEDARQKFNVRFYLLAILFILFDIEAMFLIPWCVSLSLINYIGYLIMMEFILELFLGFLYVWYIGGLDWE